MSTDDTARLWALLRHQVIGELLASPPERGQLREELERLAAKLWKLPSGELRHFGLSTIERWYYQALKTREPTEALRRKTRKDAGVDRAMSAALLQALHDHYKWFPTWSFKLHADNLAALTRQKPELGPAPSYTTVRRKMRARGWIRKRMPRTEGQRRAMQRRELREVRSYEKSHAMALLHFDFHQAKRQIATPDGKLHTPVCLCILDDFSRLCCHIQWYLAESAETLAHGLMQAFLKRGLPRGTLSDNGSAMRAGEIICGMSDLGIQQDMTLPHSPYQNGKQEAFWGQVEGRLMAMLSAIRPLELKFLNYATQAWAEQDYNRELHSELGVSPLERFMQGPNVSRPCPDFATLCLRFTRIATRTQRRSDGTVSVNGVRFEIPSAWRREHRLTLRFAEWDLSRIHIVEPRHHTKFCATIAPLDKRANANGMRRTVEPVDIVIPEEPRDQIPPLMRQLLSDYAATGLPPAYMPHRTEMMENDDA